MTSWIRTVSIRKARLFWPVIFILVLADFTTKRAALEGLTPHVPRPVVGDVLRFTLALNPGAAFGITLGPQTQGILIILAAVALAFLLWLYRHTSPHQTGQIMALSLVFGGAMGNLLDRLAGPVGVVDFIDIGLGPHRWWAFNLADVAIVLGSVLLLRSLYRLENRPVLDGRA